jgi:hypothetical protein
MKQYLLGFSDYRRRLVDFRRSLAFTISPVGKKTVTAGKSLNDTQKRASPSHA